MLHRRIEELLDSRKGDNFVELAADFPVTHPQNRTVKVDVLAAGQLVVKTGPHFEQAADAAANDRPAGGRLGNTRHDFQERAFAGAVATNDADHFPRLHVERHVLKGPEFFGTARVPREMTKPAHRVDCKIGDDLPQGPP